jgi:plastocyanin
MRVVRFGLIALAAAVLVSGAGVYGIAHWKGLAADRTPGRLETAVARRLVWLSIPAADRNRSNPHAADRDAWREGADHFGEHCATCHGRDGRGHSEVGPRMYPPVPDLASPAVQRLSDGALFSIIQHGVRWTGMPAFGTSHTPEETWKLVSFIRLVPRLTPADLQRLHEHARDTSAAAKTITIDGTTFEPDDITVEAGDTVAWINKDPFPHNVSSSSGGFRSGELQPEERWTHRATARGTFRYVCTLHPGMTGVLHVR